MAEPYACIEVPPALFSYLSTYPYRPLPVSPLLKKGNHAIPRGLACDSTHLRCYPKLPLAMREIPHKKGYWQSPQSGMGAFPHNLKELIQSQSAARPCMLLRAFLMSKKRLLKGAEKSGNLSLSTRQPLAPILGTPLLHVDIARSAVRPRLKPFAQQGNFFHQIHRQGSQLRVCVKLALQIGHAPRAR